MCSYLWPSLLLLQINAVPHRHTARLHFPASLAVWCGHVTEFWQMSRGKQWCVTFPDLTHKNLSPYSLFFFSSRGIGWLILRWWKQRLKIASQQSSHLRKLKPLSLTWNNSTIQDDCVGERGANFYCVKLLCIQTYLRHWLGYLH